LCYEKHGYHTYGEPWTVQTAVETLTENIERLLDAVLKVIFERAETSTGKGKPIHEI
jgi:hypothetical protein